MANKKTQNETRVEIKPPDIPGSFELNAERTAWFPRDEKTKKRVKNFIEAYGEKAIKNIQIK